MKKILAKDIFNKILAQIGEGKKRALKLLYDSYGKFIYYSALSVCKSSMISDEVVDDVLLRIWDLAASSKIEVDNPEGWIYRISVNCAKNKIEREVVPLNDNIADVKDEIETILDESSFYSYIEDLTEEEQAIFVARFIKDLKFEDIAIMLDMPLSTLTTKYYRALQKIKEKIEKFASIA